MALSSLSTRILLQSRRIHNESFVTSCFLKISFFSPSSVVVVGRSSSSGRQERQRSTSRHGFISLKKDTGKKFFSSSSSLFSSSIPSKGRVTVPLSSSLLSLGTLQTRSFSSSSSSTPSSSSSVLSSSSSSSASSSSSTKVKSTFALYSELSKLRLSSLVVLTSGAGFLLAGSPINWSLCLVTVIGTSLAAASANTFNQLYEKHTDSLMKRTQNRPLPTGNLSSMQALTFGSSMMALSTAILYYGTNPVTTALGIGNILLYAAIYTPLKQKTTYNTAIGAIVGAIPPLMGWTAATGGTLLSIDPLLLATILTSWQFPHFYALAWTLRKDYARGGYQMVPVLDTTDGKYTAWLSLRATILLSLIPTLATIFDVTNPMFAVEGLVLNTYFLYLASKFYRTPNDLTARVLFRASLWYLPVLILLMVFHSTSWAQQTNIQDEATVITVPPVLLLPSSDRATTDIPRGQSFGNTIEAIVRWLRYIGKTLCIHEIYIEQMNTIVASSLKQVLGLFTINPSLSSSSSTSSSSLLPSSSSTSDAKTNHLSPLNDTDTDNESIAALNKSAETLARLQTRKMCPVTVIEDATSTVSTSVVTTTTKEKEVSLTRIE